MWTCAGCGVPSPDRRRSCACPTNVVCDGKKQAWKRDEMKAQPITDGDIEYLGQAEAHADEGPLGEVAARSILKIALRLAAERANASSE